MKLTLEKPWTYLTPLVTIDYPAGTHIVRKEIGAAAIAAGAMKDDSNGDSGAETGEAEDSVAYEGGHGPDGDGASGEDLPADDAG